MKAPTSLLLVEIQSPNGDLYTEAFGISTHGSGTKVDVVIKPLGIAIHTPADYEGFEDFLRWLGNEVKPLFIEHYDVVWDDIKSVRIESE